MKRHTMILFFFFLLTLSNPITLTEIISSHKRLNILTNEWILVSPGRDQRPWSGKIEIPPSITTVSYDPKCYLCPGNQRIGGLVNPQYSSTFVFDNDYAALKPDLQEVELTQGLLVTQPERGICRVVCFSPRHDLTIAHMPLQDVRHVIDIWRQQYAELINKDFINWVQIFENRGEMMGCSNPHPHSQIWAESTLPNEAAKELTVFEQRASCVLCDYLTVERERIVCENNSFIAAVPFWASWPFEILVISKRHVSDLLGMNEMELNDLAHIMKQVTQRYDGLFQVPFPYTMGLHQLNNDKWHFHSHYYPPLLRSATIRKFMVGYEMLAMPQRDMTPESAAARLRAINL